MTDVADTDDIPESEADTVESPAKKSRLKLVIIAAAALVVALAAGGGIYFFLLQGGATGTAGEAAVAEAAEIPAYIYDLPTMTVNLSSPESEPQFLKLTVALELPDKEMQDVIAPRIARVMDAFQVYMRELRRSDLEGSAGIYRLKEELRRRVNLAIYPAEVDNILFKEILVQ